MLGAFSATDGLWRAAGLKRLNVVTAVNRYALCPWLTTGMKCSRVWPLSLARFLTTTPEVEKSEGTIVMYIDRRKYHLFRNTHHLLYVRRWWPYYPCNQREDWGAPRTLCEEELWYACAWGATSRCPVYCPPLLIKSFTRYRHPRCVGERRNQPSAAGILRQAVPKGMLGISL